MTQRHADLKLYPTVPADRNPKDVAITHLATNDHFKAVSDGNELSCLIGAVPG